MANTFLAASGRAIGRSLCEPDLLGTAREVMATLERRGAALFLPDDVVTATEFSAGALSMQRLVDQLGACKTIVWNGPLGVFEMEPFSYGTRTLATAIAESKAYSIAGGGDTVAAINRFDVLESIDYVSTAGGAFQIGRA